MSATTLPAVRHRSRPTTKSEDGFVLAPARPVGASQHPNVLRQKEDPDAHIRVFKEYTESQALVDPFLNLYQAITGGTYTILTPPYNLYSLVRLPTENNILHQCVDAMVTNIEGNGYQLEYIGPDEGDQSAPAQAEKTMIENLMDCPNDEHSLQELRDRMRTDLEYLGNAYLEVGRDAKGRVCMINHVPGQTIRLTAKEVKAVPVVVVLKRDGRLERVPLNKRFRFFVQLVGARRVFFKEFGDPRVIDPSTGLEDPTLPMEASATEIIHISLYNPASPYGLPRWINQLPAIMGSRQAELTNLDFFKENAIPAMALMVSGGMVTQSTLDTIEDHFLAARGRQAMNRILVIEAQGNPDSAAADGAVPPPKLELHPLQGDRQSDALFQEYDAANMDKVRSSFRIGPLFTGHAQEHNYATARTSMEIAESQVFSPERRRFDEVVNSKILATLGVQYWSLKSNAPKITGVADIIQAAEVFDRMGGMTPNLAINLANQYFDMDVEPIKEAWGDFPFPVVAALATTGKCKGFEAIVDAAAMIAAAGPEGAGSSGVDTPDKAQSSPPPKLNNGESTKVKADLALTDITAGGVNAANLPHKRMVRQQLTTLSQGLLLIAKHVKEATFEQEAA